MSSTGSTETYFGTVSKDECKSGTTPYKSLLVYDMYGNINKHFGLNSIDS